MTYRYDPDKMTQWQRILYHLANGQRLTRQDAMLNHRIANITARIAELRQKGITIVSVWKEHPATGQRYVAYVLSKGQRVILIELGVLHQRDNTYYPAASI